MVGYSTERREVPDAAAEEAGVFVDWDKLFSGAIDGRLYATDIPSTWTVNGFRNEFGKRAKQRGKRLVLTPKNRTPQGQVYYRVVPLNDAP